MDKLMSAANASNVEKTHLGMLELDWEGDDRGLRIKHQNHEATFYWLKLTREDVDKLSMTILYCLQFHRCEYPKCGNYWIAIEAGYSREGALRLLIDIREEENNDLKPSWTRTFEGYRGGINLLEGICEFRRLNNLDRSNDEILKQQKDSITDNLMNAANTSAIKKQMRIEWNKRENKLLFHCIENGVKNEKYIELEADKDLIIDILYILYNKLTDESGVYLEYEIRDKNESILQTIYGEGTSAEPHKLLLIFGWSYTMRCTKDDPESFSYLMRPESFWEKVSWDPTWLLFDEYEGGKVLHEGIMDFIKENDLVSESWERN